MAACLEMSSICSLFRYIGEEIFHRTGFIKFNKISVVVWFFLSFACKICVISFTSKFKTLFPDQIGQITTHLPGTYLPKTRGVLPEKLARSVRPPSKTLTLFMTKICDIIFATLLMTVTAGTVVLTWVMKGLCWRTYWWWWKCSFFF